MARRIVTTTVAVLPAASGAARFGAASASTASATSAWARAAAAGGSSARFAASQASWAPAGASMGGASGPSGCAFAARCQLSVTLPGSSDRTVDRSSVSGVCRAPRPTSGTATVPRTSSLVFQSLSKTLTSSVDAAASSKTYSASEKLGFSSFLM